MAGGGNRAAAKAGDVARLPQTIANDVKTTVTNNALQRAAPLSPEFKANPLAPNALDRVATEPQGAVSATGLPTPTQPQPVGAQVTPPNLTTAGLTPGDIAKSEQSQLLQTANDRAPTGKDTAEYVPGVQRTLGAVDFSPINARDEKVLSATDPAFKENVAKREQNNNTVMKDYYHDTIGAGDPKQLENLEEAATEKVKGSLAKAFDNSTPVATSDVQGVVDGLDKILSGPAGKRDAVAPVITNVRSKFFDANGNLETDPETLYGARQNITDKLSSAGQLDAGNKLAKSQLIDAKNMVDQMISTTSPNFPTYLKDVAEAKKPVAAMSYLQDYLTGSKSLTDIRGNLQFNRVQKMLDNTVTQRASPGFTTANSEAKALSPEQMQGLFNLRNELAAMNHKDYLASTKGSDTTQLLSDAARAKSGVVGNALRTAGDYAVHAGLAKTTFGLGNPLYVVAKRGLAARREAKQAAANAATLQARKAELLSSHPDFEGPAY
jgi:hypothetical protein